MRTIGLIVLSLSIATASHAQQDSAYTPSFVLPDGDQLVAIYIGASDCGACHQPDLKAALESAKLGLQRRAIGLRMSFAAIGVALDWSPADGFGFLQNSGAFDEIWTGANWANLGAMRYIWADSTAAPAMPQLIVLRRTIGNGAFRITVGPDQVLLRLVGPSAIEAWVHRGLPLPEAQ